MCRCGRAKTANCWRGKASATYSITVSVFPLFPPSLPRASSSTDGYTLTGAFVRTGGDVPQPDSPISSESLRLA